jgi:hypothetical protein
MIRAGVDVPMLPEAKAIYDKRKANLGREDPEARCLPPGVPRMSTTPYPWSFLQTPKEIWIVYEGGAHIWRKILMDGRPHDPRAEQTWLGDSIGHWEGDTLVVDVVGFNEATWLDYFGHPHTDQLHVVERYSRPNKQTLHYEALIDDMGAYTRPFKVAWDIPWRANAELSEYICQENNKYLQRLTDDFGQPVFGK